MPVGQILPQNDFYLPARPEMDGATLTVVYDGSIIIAIVSYIGRTVFHITPALTRVYNLDSRKAVGSYCNMIIKRLASCNSQGVVSVCMSSTNAQQYKCLEDYARAVVAKPTNFATPKGYPWVWADAAWDSVTVLNPEEDMAKQIKASDADDLISAIYDTGKPAMRPASDPPVPTPRIEEGDVSSTKIPPHRKSVIKNLRDPKTYLAYLSR